MSVNSIGYVNSYNFLCTSTLSEETRRKLIALGIDPSMVTSEAQAKILIEQLENLRKQEKIQPFNSVDNSKQEDTAHNENLILSMMEFKADVNKIILGL